MATNSKKVTKSFTNSCPSTSLLLRRETTAATAVVVDDGPQKWTVIPSVDDNKQKKTSSSAIASLASNTEPLPSNTSTKGNTLGFVYSILVNHFILL